MKSLDLSKLAETQIERLFRPVTPLWGQFEGPPMSDTLKTKHLHLIIIAYNALHATSVMHKIKM